MLNLRIPFSPAILNGLKTSVVSPDYDTESKAPFIIGKSFSSISEAIFTSMLLKQPISLIRYYPYKEA